MQPPVFSCAQPRDDNMEAPQAVTKGEFPGSLTDSLCAASIIHELNNPLTAIKMGLEQIKALVTVQPYPKKEQFPAPPFKKACPELVEVGGLGGILLAIEEAQERATSLIESLYQLYQGITPEKTLTTPLELKAALETLLRAEPQTTSVDVQFETNPVTPIWGHLRLLAQVLLNLVKNAAAAQASVVQINIHGEDKHALITVHDNGHGFPTELQKKSFKPFQKRQGTSGLGMGLYLSHIIVLAHQGAIEIESHEARGTLFTIRLPG